MSVTRLELPNHLFVMKPLKLSELFSCHKMETKVQLLYLLGGELVNKQVKMLC